MHAPKWEFAMWISDTILPLASDNDVPEARWWYMVKQSEGQVEIVGGDLGFPSLLPHLFFADWFVYRQNANVVCLL